MWQAAMELAGDATVGLDGVVARQADYRRSGFELVRRNVRYEGRGGGGRPAGLADVADAPRRDLIAFDRTVFPAERVTFLERWLPPEGGSALVVPDGGVRGYGAIRPCRAGWKIGPLFADNPETAQRLFDGLAAVAGDEPLYLDVPEPNVAAVALAKGAGMTPVFETARMYRGTAPDEPVERIFGVTTFELG
jgi:GNAT acetyltransferase-like protein